MKKEDIFKPKNCRNHAGRIHFSPSRNYSLTISHYKTQDGCWDYTEGYVVDNDLKPIATIQRNYSSFPFLFIEDHPNGHDYLVCGEDYQGQTVIELDTGKRKDYLPKAAEDGFGFCWAEYVFNKGNNILIVDGCYWACPYEFKFYDFSDPMNGWPEFISDDFINADEFRKPKIRKNGNIYCFKSFDTDPIEEFYNENDDLIKKPKIAAIKIYKIIDNKLSLLNELVSDKEKQLRIEWEEANKKYKEWLEAFRQVDPLYLKYLNLLNNKKLSPSDYESHGITHEGWCPDFNKEEKRWCRRIVTKGKYTVDLEWGVETGPIKLVIYKNNKHLEDKFFMEHSERSMEEAFNYVFGLLKLKKWRIK